MFGIKAFPLLESIISTSIIVIIIVIILYTIGDHVYLQHFRIHKAVLTAALPLITGLNDSTSIDPGRLNTLDTYSCEVGRNKET